MTWIHVKEQLPEPHPNPLLYTEVEAVHTNKKGSRVVRAVYLNKLGRWRISGSNSDSTKEISHWMPLPALPHGLVPMSDDEP